MRNRNVVKIVACLILGICAQIPATAQTADSTLDPAQAKVVPSVVPGPVIDEDFQAISAPPILRRHVMLPASSLPDANQPRTKPMLRVATGTQATPVNTGTGIVYTCAPNVATSTCNYLNTVVAGYYNSVFKNANANIYVQFGNTGLGSSVGFYNLVHYTPYVTALTSATNKSSIQTSALSAINAHATPVYGTQNIMEVTVSLGSAFGFTGLLGINAAETASCTPYTAGCYNEIVTVADATNQANGGFTLYYDDQGGTEAANQYDFYAVVQHETDEVLGTSSCISTGTGSLVDGCDGPAPAGSNGVPSAVDLDRYDSPGVLAADMTPSTSAGQYFSYDGGAHYGAYGRATSNSFKVYNTIANGNDFADYTSSSPLCGTNEAVQDAEGCPGEDAGLTVLNDGQAELTILNALGFKVPEAAITSPAPGSTLSGTSATFTWSAVSGATAYWVYVGSTGVGSSNIFANTSSITATSQAVTGLPTSGTVYVRVYSLIGGFWTSTDFTYTGGGSAPAVTLSPTSLTFASTTVGATTAAQVVTVKNSGTAALTLTSEAITGTNATSFMTSGKTCGTSLAAGASCTVSVEFMPAAAGTLSAALSIADNATGSPQSVKLSGTGAAASAPAVTLSPTSLAFASTTVGATTAAQVVTVKNSGTATLTLTSETITGTNATSFLRSATTCGTSLAAGASCTVSVEFKPAAAGALSAALSIADNATGSPQSVKLTGTGTTTTGSTLSLTPTTLALGTENIGAISSGKFIAVKNTGATTLTINGFSFSGTNPTSFTQLNTCQSTLAAGVTCYSIISLAPKATGSLSASYNVSSSAGTGTVSLTGTGVATAALTFSPSSMVFPTTLHGTQSVASMLTVTNTGTSTATFTFIGIGGTNYTDFYQLNSCGTTLAVGSNCHILVIFRPAAAATYTATLEFFDTAQNEYQGVTLTGAGN